MRQGIFKLKEPITTPSGVVDRLLLDKYMEGDTIAVFACFEGMSLDSDHLRLSARLPESDDLGEEEFFLKDWSENEEVVVRLKGADLIHTSSIVAKSGYVQVHAAELNWELLEEAPLDLVEPRVDSWLFSGGRGSDHRRY